MKSHLSANLTLHGRKAARVAAIQALYQTSQSGDPPQKVTEEFKAHRFQTPSDDIMYNRTDISLFDKIVLESCAHYDQIDDHIQSVLSEEWKWDRLGLILLSILRSATFELMENSTVPVPVLINEYTEITKLFFQEREPAFINAVLDRLARKIRPLELESPKKS